MKDEFYAFIKEESKKQNDKLMMEVTERMILTHCSSGFKQSLNEILANPEVKDKAKT